VRTGLVVRNLTFLNILYDVCSWNDSTKPPKAQNHQCDDIRCSLGGHLVDDHEAAWDPFVGSELEMRQRRSTVPPANLAHHAFRDDLVALQIHCDSCGFGWNITVSLWPCCS
jgi:hypothetical protein